MFESEVERMKRHTRKATYTSIECDICNKELTDKQLEYSKANYDRNLCFSCQKLTSYKRNI